MTTAGPTGAEVEDANTLLVKAGLLRQAYSGIFHLLPLGLRVQEKLERLIDKHMSTLGASKVSLSSISSQALWAQTGRLDKGSEFFKFNDRKDSPFLLSPTHEEEITQLVGREVQSYRDLPLRLYQVSRKYRDEKRPRQGLLRGREFLMKDLYTFDADGDQARRTYDEVRVAYNNFFNELKVPFLVASADSGNMGGDLSHEYHFPNEKGEDDIISCDSCNHVWNGELVNVPETAQTIIVGGNKRSSTSSSQPGSMFEGVTHWKGVTGNRLGSVEAFVPCGHEVNLYAIKEIVNDVDMSGASRWLLDQDSPDSNNEHDAPIENSKESENQTSGGQPYQVVMFDYRIASGKQNDILNSLAMNQIEADLFKIGTSPNAQLDLTKPKTSASCPRCQTGTLKVQPAIEVGHTFHLGTRYSEPLNATIAAPAVGQNDQRLVSVQMGCHGIGISRLISAVASMLVDETGLNWPRAMAPFEVVVIATKGRDQAAAEIYDLLQSPSGHPSNSPQLDVVLDDRVEKDLIWSLTDADLAGFPVIVVLGRAFADGEVEVQCRRLKVKENVKISELKGFVNNLLSQL